MAEDRSVLIKTAYAYYQRGDWDRALEEYHKLADLDPGDLNVLNILADIYAKKGDAQEALRQYDLVAQGYDQKNQVDKVLQVYKRMLKLSPSNLELQNAVKNLVQKYLDRANQLEAQDPDRSIDIYRSILKAEPHRFDASLRMAKLLMKKQQKFQAVEILLNLAETFDPATQTGRLLETLQLVVEFDPMNVEARDKLVVLLVSARESVLAIENLRALMEIHISRNDLEKAQAAAQKAIDLGDLEAYYHLGVIHFNQERFAESKQCFEKFLQKQETHVGALKYLALTHLKLNQHPEAVVAYLRILAVYVNENLLEEAREVRQTILELDPNNQAIKAFILDGPAASAPPSPPVAVPASPPSAETASAAESILDEASPPPPPPPSPPSPSASVLDMDSVVITPPLVEKKTDEKEQQQVLLTQAQGFVEKGLYDQAIDLYLDMIKRWSDWPEIKGRLQQVYALMVKPAEPEAKHSSPEDMKAELEKELREQMKKELEAQTRRLVEEQARMQEERLNELDRMKREQEEERLRMQKEIEARMLDQVKRSKEEEELREQLRKDFEERHKAMAQEREEERTRLQHDLETKMAEQMKKVQEGEDLREQLRKEFEEQQKNLARERETERQKLQLELEAKMNEQLKKVKDDDSIREQLRKDFEERQNVMAREWERMEREKEEAVQRLRAEMEQSQHDMEQRLRSQVEGELREKIEREGREREVHDKELRDRDDRIKELMRQEDEARRRFEEEGKAREKDQAGLQNEIFKRMERLRSEKEREPAPPTPSSQMQEVSRPPTPPPPSTGAEPALEDIFVRQTLADIYAKQGLFVEAVKIYEKILNEDPDNEDVREKLRDILRLKGI